MANDGGKFSLSIWRIAAYKRHWELWNTTPQVAGIVAGLAASMEREAAKNPDYDVSSINTLKVSLMGPLAGIGDSFFWGSLKIIATGIGVSFALQGNILGPILYFLVYNIPASLARHLLPILGFNLGNSFMEKMNKAGIMPFLTKCCNIIGIMMIGAMECSRNYRFYFTKCLTNGSYIIMFLDVKKEKCFTNNTYCLINCCIYCITCSWYFIEYENN